MDSSSRIEYQAAAWLARRDRPDWGPREQAALDAWLDARTEHRVAWLRLESAWREAERLRALAAGLAPGQVPPRGHWARWLSGGADQPGLAPVAEDAGEKRAQVPDWAQLRFAAPPRPRRRHGVLSGLAATLALAVAGLGAWAWYTQPVSEAAYASARGQLASHVLEDGSRVVLAADSQVRVLMGRRQRLVQLQRGEAIFEVASDRSRPFVVEAGRNRAVAVGTRYAVRRDGEAVRVVVTEGRVRLEAGQGTGPESATVLGAGSVATAGADGVRLQVVAAGVAQRLLEWHEGYLAFDDVPLAEAANEFNRFGERRLELADPVVARLRIGGNFRWDNLDGFVGLLEQGFPVRVERHPDRVVLHARQD